MIAYTVGARIISIVGLIIVRKRRAKVAYSRRADVGIYARLVNVSITRGKRRGEVVYRRRVFA